MADRFTRKCIVCGAEVKPAKLRRTPLPMTRHEFECFKKRPDLIPNIQLRFIFDRRVKIEEREENIKRLNRVRARTRNNKGEFIKKRILVAFYLLSSALNFWAIPEAHGQVLAGTHQAQFVQPYWPKEDYRAFIIPIQDMYPFYGPMYGWQGRHYQNYGSRYYNQGPNGYGVQGYEGPSSDWESPEEYYERRSRRYQYRYPYNNTPWSGRRW